MQNLKRKILSQNFLHSRKLVKKLILGSSIDKSDTILEIGFGKGIITQQLIQNAKNVIAIELDTHWYNYLQVKLNGSRNLKLYNEDFLNFSLPKIPYKVFSNIPFSIEGKIIRKIIDDENPPKDCYLIMMKELAYRLSAPYKENEFSIMHKPWFNFSIYYHFKPEDFTPFSNVSAVMLRFAKRKKPLVTLGNKNDYQKFIRLGFTYGLPIFKNLKNTYGYKRTLNAFNQTNINKSTKPGFLSLEKWTQLYEELQ